MNAPDFPASRKPSWFRRTLRWSFLSIGALALLIGLFYTVENWRGKRAWEQCKRELEAKGAVLDWNAYIPAPVPDEQNIFKAPKMAEWFVGRGFSELSKRLNLDSFSQASSRRDATAAAELTLIPPDATVTRTDADLVLAYSASGLTVGPENPANASGPDVIPLIVMDEVPLGDAIHNLARQAGLNYLLDPQFAYGNPGPDGRIVPIPTVSIRWKNMTARQALIALLDRYHLQIVDDPKTLITRITQSEPRSVDRFAREQLDTLLRNVPARGKPARIFVRTNTTPTPKEVEAFFLPTATHSVQVESVSNNFFRVSLSPPTGVVARLTVLSPDAQVAPEDADLVLRYHHSVLTIETRESLSRAAGQPEPVIPLVVLDDVPLTDAIRNLARQAGLTYSLDPGVSKHLQAGSDGKVYPQPCISIRWENVTARQALLALLDNNSLVLVEDPEAGTARICPRDPAKQVFVESAVRQQLDKWWQNALRSQENASNGPSLKGSQNIRLVLQPPGPVRPVHIVVRARTLSVTEVGEFFSDRTLRIETAGSNAFRMFWKQPQVCLAADYLAWSDRFEPDFDLIRAALKRPYARIDGDYNRPAVMPIPNFVTSRIVAQTLAQRAQCYLLLNQPDEALHELTLLHDLCHLLEGPPNGRPTTLVSAMINVAVAGVYVQAVADGFQLHAWQEPQLAALEQQLREVDLMPPVVEGFRGEQVFLSRSLDVTPRRQFANLFRYETQEKTFWQSIKEEPGLILLSIVPRGWIDQNKVVHARLVQLLIESCDPTNQVLFPRKLQAMVAEANAKFDRPLRPYTFIAALGTPNFVRANQTVARNQTLANEGQIACALERYRLARGRYPGTLNALVPQFIEKIPHDVIGGQPLKYRLSSEGTFLLYSVGMNETDDGGVDLTSASGIDKGDWVWRAN